MLEYAPSDARALALARAFLPGPLTLVVRRPPVVDASIVGGLATLGLRVPNHELCAALLARCGPLAATSANLSGAPAYSGRDASDPRAQEKLPEADLFIDAGPAPLGVASTVVDLSGDVVRLIRAGAIPFEAIERALGAGNGPG
jgi:L-threonylcarbamoyladenylate synthase